MNFLSRPLRPTRSTARCAKSDSLLDTKLLLDALNIGLVHIVVSKGSEKDRNKILQAIDHLEKAK